jgi:hypothetical protein
MIQYRYQIPGVQYTVGANAAFLVSPIHIEDDVRPITTAAPVAGLRADSLQLNGLKQTDTRYQLDTLIYVVGSCCVDTPSLLDRHSSSRTFTEHPSDRP